VDELGLRMGSSAALQLTPMGVCGTVGWGGTGESPEHKHPNIGMKL